MKIWKKLLALGLACSTLGAGAMLATGCKEQKKELAYYLSEDGTYYIVSGIGTYEGDTLTIPERIINYLSRGFLIARFMIATG